jgi:maltose alpha-D-glucosyltransferase / alpha-amylase
LERNKVKAVQFVLPDDTLWYKDAIFYELHVRAFADGNGDGIGDFRGATAKLDYLRQLGITCIWLLPFYQSPLKDDGYDIADYYRVHPAYGTLQDFCDFVLAARRRGIRVIADLVLNHTSDQHPWFLEARSSPLSPKRDYYVWSDSDQKYRDARVIFHTAERSNWTYDPVAGAFYWHRFFHHQPDLNYENPEVRREMLEVMRFWLDLGLDGFRCDAVPHLFEREGTSCENLPETHAYVRELRRELGRAYPGRILLCEANQSVADLRAYFGNDDEFHLAFLFPLVPHLFLSLCREEGGPLADALAQLPPIPPACQWAPFLRNHDELTLSRITEEERADLFLTYAPAPSMRLNSGIRRRLAPMLNNDRRKLALAHSILLSLPGSPVLYYGDEIGMGDNVALPDRYGLRTPMQWGGDRNAGFSRATAERLYLPVIDDSVYGYTTVNVEAQLREESSPLRTVRALIAVRKSHPVFARGSVAVLPLPNPRILAYLREDAAGEVLVLHNLAGSAQPVELDLARFRGATPEEMVGDSTFPVIGESPYFLSMGAYDSYWLRLVPGGDV